MDAHEWRDCADPRAMLDRVRGLASPRKLRLFAVACCRGVGPSVPWASWDRAVGAAERYADDGILWPALDEARLELGAALRGFYGAADFARQAAPWAACMLDIEANVANAAGLAAVQHPEQDAVQVGLLRCLFDDVALRPRRPPAAVWLTADVRALATTIYDDKAFENMPILGDALEDAGCADPAVLSHCRDRGRHVRGCWLLDQLLGKA